MSYEYQRATREYNRCEATGVRLNNQITRYTKRVANMENVFEKAKNKVETKYTSLSRAASSTITQGQTMSQTLNGFRATLGTIVIGGVNLLSMVSVPTSLPSGTNLQTALSTYGAQASTALSQLIEAAKDAETEALSEKQDDMLAPIQEKESDLKAEETLNASLTTLWKERKEAAKSQLAEDAKDSMSSFGLKG